MRGSVPQFLWADDRLCILGVLLGDCTPEHTLGGNRALFVFSARSWCFVDEGVFKLRLGHEAAGGRAGVVGQSDLGGQSGSMRRICTVRVAWSGQ